MLTPLVLAATLALQAFAASPSQRPRALAEVIELAMQEGETKPMDAETATRLGFPEREFPYKRLRYKQSECPDRREHTFGVLYEKDENGAERPLHLLLTVGTGKKENDVVTIDSLRFLMSLDGTIKLVNHGHGRAGEVQIDKVKLTSKIRKQGQAELTFHTKVAFALGLHPAK